MTPKLITIRVDGKTKTVDRNDYIKGKTAQLREFGYTTLTEDEVRRQLNNVYDGTPRDVIGLFIERDIVE